MILPEHLNTISGWILPCSTWHPVDEWWHVHALYNLQDSGLSELQSRETKKILSTGDEDKIRTHVADLGFIKLSRCLIDGTKMTQNQLSTLQNLLSICNPEDELSVLIGNENQLKRVSIERILKLKNPNLFFEK